MVLEHGLHGAAGAPIARDMITFLYNRKLAEDRLAVLEEGWGGNIEQRMAKKAYEWAHRNDPAIAAPPVAAAPSSSPPPPPTGAEGKKDEPE